jgi:ferredoxin-NADP reductase
VTSRSLLTMSMFHVGKIIRKYLASPTVIVLELEVPTLKSFLPGQWVDFVAKPHEWIGGFSIASSSKDLPRLTLAIKKSSHPPATWVHEQSRVDTYVEVQVGGNCTLVEDARERPSVFCAGGIGIAPVLCQYREFLSQRGVAESQQGAPAMFLYSVSTPDELVFADELSELISTGTKKNELDKMTFSLTQSSEWRTPSKYPNVELTTGRVLKPFLDEASKDSTFYMCGPPAMLDDAVSHLEARGIPSSNIRYEKWW